MSDNKPTQVFSWIPVDRDDPDTLSKFSFKEEEDKKTLYCQRLTDSDPGNVVFHIQDFLDKMDALDIQDDQSYFTLFPRTLSPVLKASWQVHYDSIGAGTVLDLNRFKITVRNFVSDHVTDQVRSDALDQIRQCRKPRKLTVRTFRYRLTELNSLVAWFPGTLTILNEEELSQTFYNAMPVSWKDKFVSAGKTRHTMTMPQLVDYFGSLEVLAEKRQAEQNQRQKKSSVAAKRDKPIARYSKHYGKKPAGKTAKLSARSDCPVHPGMGHTWGDCYNNPSNKDKKKRTFNKEKSEGNRTPLSNKKPKGNFHAEKDDDDVDMTGFFTDDDNSSKSKSVPQNSSEILSFFTHELDLFHVQIEDCFQGSSFDDAASAAYMSLFHSSDFQDDVTSNLNDIVVPVDTKDVVPISLMTVDTIQGQKSKHPLKGAF